MIEVIEQRLVDAEAVRREQEYTEKLFRSRNILLYPIAIARRRLMKDLEIWEENKMS